MSFHSDSLGPMGLRIAVIGAQTAAPESAKPYTVYRTVATYEGQCFERLLRYSEFQWFYKRLHFRNKSLAKIKSFPKKKWSRKASLEDDVIEARQVMLNEFMRAISLAELTPKSEQYLFKLLKIGQYDNGSGRVSDVRVSNGASFLKSDRGERSARRGPLDAVVEVEEESDKLRSTTELEAAATLTGTSVTFPAISSNATTVLADDERSAIGSQSRAAHSEDLTVPNEETESSDASESVAVDGNCRDKPRAAPLKAVSSSIQPSSYSDMVLNRPQLKASNSVPPGRRTKRTDAPVEASVPTSGPAKSLTNPEVHEHSSETDEEEMSPEAKYSARIHSQLNTLSRLFSESETETDDMESARSTPAQPSMPLTA